MAENETIVSLKIEPDTSSVKSAINSINKMIQSSLKTSVDLTFNIKGEKQVKALKERLKTEIKIPVGIKETANQIEKIRERLSKEIKIPVTPVKGGGGIGNAVPKSTPAPIVPKITGVQAFLGQMKELGQQAATFISAGILIGIVKGVTQGIIEVGSKFENLKMMISNALGGVEEGNMAMEMLKSLASETSQNIEDVAGGFNKLINRGIKPAKKEIIQMTDVAKSQGKDLDQYIEAILDAMTGENERLKEFGVKTKDAGDSVIFTFKGISTEVKKSEQDIYNYLVALGKVPGVVGMSAKAAGTFDGRMQSIKSSIDSIKIEIFQEMKEALEPILEVLEGVVTKIKEWVEVHPKLATAITVITLGIVGLIGVVLILIPILSTLSVVVNSITWPLLLVVAVIAAVVVQIGILIWVLQDLWNGLTKGESYIFAIIDGFLEWLGIGITVQDMIDGINQAFNMVADVVMNYVVPVIVEQWNFLVEIISAYISGLVDKIAIWIEIIVSIFTGNIPRAAQGFEMLKQNAIAIFEQMVSAAANAAAKIIAVFANAVDKAKGMIEGLGPVGKFFAGKLGKVSSGAKSVAGKLGRAGSEFSARAGERKQKIHEYTGQGKSSGKRFKMPGSKKNKSTAGMFDKMTVGGKAPTGGNNKNKKGGGKSGGGKKGGSAGSNKNQESIQEQKAIVTAIEGLQEVLKKTGYSITSEIRRADLFEAKRQALLASQRQTGVNDLWNTIKEKFVKKDETKSTPQKIELFLSNGSKASSFGITKNTSLGDFFKIINSRNGG